MFPSDAAAKLSDGELKLLLKSAREREGNIFLELDDGGIVFSSYDFSSYDALSTDRVYRH